MAVPPAWVTRAGLWVPCCIDWTGADGPLDSASLHPALTSPPVSLWILPLPQLLPILVSSFSQANGLSFPNSPPQGALAFTSL